MRVLPFEHLAEIPVVENKAPVMPRPELFRIAYPYLYGTAVD